MKCAQSANRIAARQDHDFDPVAACIQRQQLADQRKRDARFGGHGQPLALQRFIRLQVALLVHAVLFLEVEQRARRDCHHQFVGKRNSHLRVSVLKDQARNKR
jgi:hypothetical protein